MSERKSEVLLRHYLKKLKLPTILREYAPVAAVISDNYSYRSTTIRITG
jgi:hypothetical protein